MKTPQELYELFNRKFKDQIGLALSEAVEINPEKNGFTSKIEKLGISIASMQLDLTEEEQGDMADFLTLIN